MLATLMQLKPVEATNIIHMLDSIYYFRLAISDSTFILGMHIKKMVFDELIR